MSSFMPTDQDTTGRLISVQAQLPVGLVSPGQLEAAGPLAAGTGPPSAADALPTDAQAVGQSAPAAPPWLPIFKFGADHPSDGRSLIAAFGADPQVNTPKDTSTPGDGQDPKDPRGKNPTKILQN